MQSLLKSKTFWTGVGAVVIGTGMIIQGDNDQGVQTILAGLAMIFLRHSISKATEE